MDEGITFSSNDELPTDNIPRYKIGDKVIIRPDAAEIIHSISSGSWDIDLVKSKFMRDNIKKPLKVVKKFIVIEANNDKTANIWWSCLQSDVDLSEAWFIDAALKPSTPDYSPRRIDRLLDRLDEGVFNEKYPYTSLIIAVNNKEELEDLRLNGHLENDICNRVEAHLMWGQVLYIRMFSDYHDNTVVRTTTGTLSKLDQLSQDIGFTYERVFTSTDIKKGIINNIKNSGQSTPNYLPKKINRITESQNPVSSFDMVDDFRGSTEDKTLKNINEAFLHIDYPYNSIVIAINDQKEANELFMLGYGRGVIDNITDFLNRGVKTYVRLYKGTDNETITSIGTLSRVEEVSNSLHYTYEKVFTVNDVKRGLIDKIKKTGNYFQSPDYSPRKIDRTLESKNTILSLDKWKESL